MQTTLEERGEMYRDIMNISRDIMEQQERILQIAENLSGENNQLQGKSAELQKVLQASQQQLECQMDLAIPLQMINKLAGEVRGLKEEQLQRFQYLEQCVATTQAQFAQQQLILQGAGRKRREGEAGHGGSGCPQLPKETGSRESLADSACSTLSPTAAILENNGFHEDISGIQIVSFCHPSEPEEPASQSEVVVEVDVITKPLEASEDDITNGVEANKEKVEIFRNVRKVEEEGVREEKPRTGGAEDCGLCKDKFRLVRTEDMKTNGAAKDKKFLSKAVSFTSLGGIPSDVIEDAERKFREKMELEKVKADERFKEKRASEGKVFKRVESLSERVEKNVVEEVQKEKKFKEKNLAETKVQDLKEEKRAVSKAGKLTKAMSVQGTGAGIVSESRYGADEVARYESPDESCYSDCVSLDSKRRRPKRTEKKEERKEMKEEKKAEKKEEKKDERAVPPKLGDISRVTSASLSTMSPNEQEDYVASLRSTVKRLQEAECSFEALDPMEEAGEEL